MNQWKSASGLCALFMAMAAAGACGEVVEESLSTPSETSETTAEELGAAPPPLSQVAVPQPVGGDIVNLPAAVRLGKALFWDIQAGGDGNTACASCHFNAGADNRIINTINPGPNGAFQSGGVNGPGQTWNKQSIGQTDDIVGSQGVASANFTSIDPNPANAADICVSTPLAPFNTHRQVTGRNTPSAVAAIFYVDNFWDGRANSRFNGLNPFGATGNNSSGALVNVTNGSLASQAVGPPNNEVEMSCLGRTFNGPNSLGAKLLARTPLGKQLVSPTDSVLGAISKSPQQGLNITYTQLISNAFGAAHAANAQAQFSRFYGQAIQAYEATLIPNQTPFDKFLAGNTNAMTARQKQGWNAFRGDGDGQTSGSCFSCHAGSELSDATVGYAALHGAVNVDGGDQGFHNIGVRPTSEDLGRAGVGPGGVSWSRSGSVFDRGAFKTPGLRNVKLTAPYMHNGGLATLAEVVEFYKDGGFFANSGSFSSQMDDLSVSGGDRDALVDFMANALTDCRTEKRRAPFDGPSLPLPNGASLVAVGASGTGACP